MEQLVHEGKDFDKITYSGKVIKGREFDHCRFTGCDFSNTDFSFNRFTACSFTACNLSMIKLDQSSWTDIRVQDSKAIGIRFSACDDFLFSVQFENTLLDYCSFDRKKMPKTFFRNCSLKEADFSQAILSGSTFERCDLEAAVFNTSNLSAVNFETAYHYSIDPEINNIRKAIFSTDGLIGLLHKHQIIVR